MAYTKAKSQDPRMDTYCKNHPASGIADFEGKIKAYRETGHIVFVPSSPAGGKFYKPQIEEVWLAETDIYYSTTLKRFDISYSGLNKIALAGAVSWLANETRRTDLGTDRLYVSFQAVGGIRLADGSMHYLKAEYDLPLDIIKEELEEQAITRGIKDKKTGQELDNYVNYCVTRDFRFKRRNKVKLCESGAKSRVIRFLFGLQGQYENKDRLLSKPLIITRYVLDLDNPLVEQTFLQHAAGAIGMFGPVATPIGLPNVIQPQPKTIEIEPEEENPHETDFHNLDTEGQALVLEHLAEQVGYDLDDFLKRAKKSSTLEIAPNTKAELFDHLNKMKEDLL